MTAVTPDKLRHVASEHGVAIDIVGVLQGPTVTVYRVAPEPGVPVRRVAALVSAWSLAAGAPVRYVGPDRGALVFEIPRHESERETVGLSSLPEPGDSGAYGLTVPLGLQAGGAPLLVALDSLPHLLVAGATGQGKSVYVNAVLVSLLNQAGPDRLQLLLADPKRVELSQYAALPHLLAPVATETGGMVDMLKLAVRVMEERYALMEEHGVRHVRSLPPALVPPRLVVVVDELADLMLTAKKTAEPIIARLAGKARAAGIHLILATQRPSVDVVTGLVKANIPSRVAFTVSSQVDSRVILDHGGAEALVGMGDALAVLPGRMTPVRFQAPYVTDEEVTIAVARHLTDALPALPEPDESLRRTDLDEHYQVMHERIRELEAIVATNVVAGTTSGPIRHTTTAPALSPQDELAVEMTEQYRRDAFELDARVTALTNALAIVAETLAAHGITLPEGATAALSRIPTQEAS